MLEAAQSLGCNTSSYWEYFRAREASQSHRWASKPTAASAAPRRRLTLGSPVSLLVLPTAQVLHAKQRKEREKLSRGGQVSPAELFDGASAAAPMGRLLSQQRGVGRGDVPSLGVKKGPGQPCASSPGLDTQDIHTQRYPLYPHERGDR